MTCRFETSRSLAARPRRFLIASGSMTVMPFRATVGPFPDLIRLLLCCCMDRILTQ